ncbi:bifunctional proline dehydrogenase/L-glutamate gamma-semialdehyde dehydrogenase PutA [soil metagenome]
MIRSLRRAIEAARYRDEGSALAKLTDVGDFPAALRRRIAEKAADLVRAIRNAGHPGVMEVFLKEYNLSTEEGVALMCLAEALLRVPDSATIDDLIRDKVAPSSWAAHLGQSASPLVNASTWALMLTGRVLDDDRSRGIAAVLHAAIRRLGEPVIRAAVRQAMRELGNQFVLGQTIDEAMQRGRPQEEAGYTYSYDMLGEAALTAEDADGYLDAYRDTIAAVARRSGQPTGARDGPGISVKLSALHPRYEFSQRERAVRELAERVGALARHAAGAGMGFNIDAEEADRLDLSLDVIGRVIAAPALAGWDGFGVVVQAYGRRARPVIEWLNELARERRARVMVRLVKGAYWDTEIKRAQAGGFADYPVFTTKAATDVSYLACAHRLLALSDRIYPQFATHNAHTVTAVVEMARPDQAYEFQRLHGMGESLHRIVRERHGTRCRIYAPVGAHRDLLAYLVRRLLENGANSSFVNQIVDTSVPPEAVAADPFGKLNAQRSAGARPITPPAELFAPDRANSRGRDLTHPPEVEEIERSRQPFRAHTWKGTPIIAGAAGSGEDYAIINPARNEYTPVRVRDASAVEVERALASARSWRERDADGRAAVLLEASELYEQNAGEIFAVLAREGAKTLPDAVAELREAVDFLRYYAARGREAAFREPRGVFACISPWNFPLAIFTGQIAAALAAGNGVLTKPAEATPAIAALAVGLLHRAGVPRDVLQLLPGGGAVVGAALTSDQRVAGVCFTCSTETAQAINRSMAAHLDPAAPLIAETGGLNAMIVDSTALPQQAVKDIVTSAFRSAGQRCSALRILYLQEDIREPFLRMLFAAMDELVVGDPWRIETDVGPVIDREAQHDIAAHVDRARAKGKLLKELAAPEEGTFVGPAVIAVDGIADLKREVFGPVLHVASFRPSGLAGVIDDINAAGYGLTFGLHTRIDRRVEQLTSALRVGNMYVNRNQIGAVVGSQPFGGEGLSGTGPKAGGPNYLPRFLTAPQGERPSVAGAVIAKTVIEGALVALPPPVGRPLQETSLPGPTGESNRLSLWPRGIVLCLGPSDGDARLQAEQATAAGCRTLRVAPGAGGAGALDGTVRWADLETLSGFDAVAYWGGDGGKRAIRKALAKRDGPILPAIFDSDIAGRCVIERHVCIDTTASGGNVALMAEQSTNGRS